MTKCIEFLSALLTPVVAIVGLAFAWLQWRTAEKSRQNALFDRRLAFYERLKKLYLAQHNEDQRDLDIEDWQPLAEEAGFLFGKDIRDHVLAMSEKPVEGSPFFPNEWFIKPFEKYLQL